MSYKKDSKENLYARMTPKEKKIVDNLVIFGYAKGVGNAKVAQIHIRNYIVASNCQQMYMGCIVGDDYYVWNKISYGRRNGYNMIRKLADAIGAHDTIETLSLGDKSICEDIVKSYEDNKNNYAHEIWKDIKNKPGIEGDKDRALFKARFPDFIEEDICSCDDNM